MRLSVQWLIRVGAALTMLILSIGNLTAGAAADDTIDGPTAALIEKAEAEGPLTVIVGLTSIAAQDEVIEQISGLDARVNVQYNLFPLLALNVGPDALDALAGSEWVVSIKEDIPQPPALDSTVPWINGDDVNNLGWDGNGQTVAILDTGIDVDHPFFASGRIAAQACYSNSSGAGISLCPDGSTAQETGNAADAETADCIDGATNLCDHGSHVAGISAGASAPAVSGNPGNGVAPGARIIAIQVFTRFNADADCGGDVGDGPCVLTSEADQISALERVLELDTSTGGPLTVAAVNMSLGSGNFSAACDTSPRKVPVDALLAAGIATVISAGNDGLLNAVGRPGCISTAVTVGSTNDDDGVSSFSNRGPLLDIFAPGCRVNAMGAEFGMTSAVPDDAFGGMCGTSMAAPMVTGAFAVLRERYPNATIATLLGYMQSTGVNITYNTNMAGTTTATTPRLNLLAALQEGDASPSISVPANITVSNAPGQAGAVVNFTVTGNDPEDGALTPSCSPASGSFFPLGTTTVSCSVTDSVGQVAGGSFSVTVIDTEPPVIIVPADITVNNDPGQPGAVVTYSVTATDNSGPVTAACSPASGSFFPIGTTTVNCSVADPSGNTANGSFTVTVIDNEPPVLTVSPNIITPADMPSGAIVDYTVSATDNSGSVTVVCLPPSGSLFLVGTTTVNCTATDPSGNTATGSFTVHVQSAAEQLGDLKAQILASMPPSYFRSQLVSYIDQALLWESRGNKQRAAFHMDEFIARVKQYRGPVIPVALANSWIAQAEQIKDALGY